MQAAHPDIPRVAVIGAGPAGLMAAETIARAGIAVSVFDRMPSPGRKLLMAGRGGLNLTHSEDFSAFLGRYGAARPWLEPALAAFPPAALVAWCEGLGQPSFVGSSGRVFPVALKASPLLRAWLGRLAGLGVRLHTNRHFEGWDAAGRLRFAGGTPVAADATVLALGGASWPRLGADGGWTGFLADLPIAPLRPANCGFTVTWSAHLRARFAGAPLKRVALTFAGRRVRGEAVITEAGIEGGAVYALAAGLREAIAADGPARLLVDLRPDLEAAELARRLDLPRRGQSLSTFLRKNAGLSPVAVALVQEALHGGDTTALPALIKSLPLRLLAAAPLARAISTAGGLRREAFDAHFMLTGRPGVFAAGEMLDWEAPTGGYLLQACFSTGAAAGRGVLAWLARPPP
ncbi:MAG: TIGR03862 family flavoprotein, partial [Rhodospirillales bacterium]|nr:TIGR03862 family flavoprotein [Rhodospirillales bacterium]